MAAYLWYVPSSELGLSQSQPLSPESVPFPPERGGGGAHSPAGEGLGESKFRRLEKKLSILPILGFLHILVHNIRICTCSLYNMYAEKK